MTQKTLSSADKKFLRGQAHAMEPVLKIGKNGLTDAVLEELNTKLAKLGLLKIRVGNQPEEWDAFLRELTVKTQSELIGSIGSVVILYRHGVKPLSASAYQ